MFIGAHVSTAGGLHTAIERAQNIGANCLQIFGASPRQWFAKLPDATDIDLFRSAVKSGGIKAVYLHAAYLPNLASPDPETIKKSIANLSTHLKIADSIGANGLIFHIGSGKELPKSQAMRQVIDGCQAILKNVSGQTELVMENSAGGGQKLGSNPEEIGEMLKAISSPRMKVCWDTAHSFEVGIIETHYPEEIKNLVDRFDKSFGLENLVVIHANDSKTAFNSRHDRHENIGQGHIGPAAFKNLAQEPRLRDKVWLLEVPGYDNQGPDAQNIEALKNCFSNVIPA